MSTEADHYAFQPTGVVTVAARMRASDLDIAVHDSPEIDVQVTALSGGEKAVRATSVELHGTTLVIDAPRSTGLPTRSVRVQLCVPEATALSIESGSGRVSAQGSYSVADVKAGSGDVQLGDADRMSVTVGSGDVRLGTAGSLRLTSGSGDVWADAAGSPSQLRTGSGDVGVGRSNDIAVTTGSGDISIGSLDGGAVLTSASGNVIVRHARQGSVTGKTVSGDIVVGVVAGTAAMLDCSSVTGRVTSDLQATDEPASGDLGIMLQLRSVSGSVEVQRG